jgi:ABC-2 type transport system permease protein
VSDAPWRGPRAGKLDGALLIARREVSSALDAGIAFVVAAGFALLASTAFMNEFFLGGRVDMSPWFALLPYLYLVFLPAISMRLWAEERRARTFETLLSMPLTAGQIVAGKFLAALALLVLLLSSSLPIVVLLAWLGDPDPGLIAGGYLAALCAGSLLLALGLVVSCLSRDQVTAFVLAVVAGAALVLLGHERVVAVLDGLLPQVRIGSFLGRHVALLERFEALGRGVVELRALVYFLGGTLVLLWLNARLVERLRD